ncbi:uncharacterized protein L969DRAFT_618741 [Mixia osmundae IAM 14324]|uniref:Uncharacterized protein n=1 Tax=Mixia osmundae (strain CBS 9802 / IAM 14324 / JCM 22182 / KY 12970) TaxID=764103 RepID=G7DUG6_MIXOS|nr:uncharacterized protein L969DRAFT_618741 [Mixia osmundae IAM 14324]KEI41099.1 hypothetical protein L969DRAFT_618741 [Mixia osmundae IAM 14324]GAA94226.1 hypothetical protein E5Q_00875 [Mixia osmundae IAM 14324]
MRSSEDSMPAVLVQSPSDSTLAESGSATAQHPLDDHAYFPRRREHGRPDRPAGLTSDEEDEEEQDELASLEQDHLAHKRRNKGKQKAVFVTPPSSTASPLGDGQDNRDESDSELTEAQTMEQERRIAENLRRMSLNEKQRRKQARKQSVQTVGPLGPAPLPSAIGSAVTDLTRRGTTLIRSGSSAARRRSTRDPATDRIRLGKAHRLSSLGGDQWHEVALEDRVLSREDFELSPVSPGSEGNAISPVSSESRPRPALAMSSQTRRQESTESDRAAGALARGSQFIEDLDAQLVRQPKLSVDVQSMSSGSASLSARTSATSVTSADEHSKGMDDIFRPETNKRTSSSTVSTLSTVVPSSPQLERVPPLSSTHLMDDADSRQNDGIQVRVLTWSEWFCCCGLFAGMNEQDESEDQAGRTNPME